MSAGSVVEFDSEPAYEVDGFKRVHVICDKGEPNQWKIKRRATRFRPSCPEHGEGSIDRATAMQKYLSKHSTCR